ncbi:MAG: DUF2505 domain-containing protein [Myxococcota bacterium]
MIEFTIHHTFGVDAGTFWDRTFMDPEFNRKLYLEHLGFVDYEVLEDTRAENGTLKRRVRGTPKAEAPKVIQKLVGDNTTYVEEGDYDGSRYRFRILSGQLGDKIQISGEMWVDAKGEDACERCVRMSVQVNIFGVGKMVEGFVEKKTRESYDKGAEFTRSYLANPQA